MYLLVQYFGADKFGGNSAIYNFLPHCLGSGHRVCRASRRGSCSTPSCTRHYWIQVRKSQIDKWIDRPGDGQKHREATKFCITSIAVVSSIAQKLEFKEKTWLSYRYRCRWTGLPQRFIRLRNFVFRAF